MRGLVLLLLAGCAGRAAAKDAYVLPPGLPTYEPATGSGGGYHPPAPRRAYLHIPAEYVDRLDWSTKSFEDAPVLFDDQPAEPIEVTYEAGKPRPRRARRGGRRSRAHRSRRLIGVSVKLVRAGGHPISRPGHAISRPSHLVSRPQHPVSRPQHPVNRPNHSVSRPDHPVSRPNHPINRPNHAISRPQHPIGLPGHPITRPQHPVRRPGHPVSRPGHPYNPVPRGSEQKAK
ncbi:MAG: hypothetical protein ACYTHK_05150 [Planctomycetota bacterium]|jgi:hypothetical protein